ncbi:MAG TPA: polyhydroxyalkanoic acid system family protein [Rudaea sp.]
MATIDIRRKHGLSLKQAKAAVTKTAASIAKKFDVKSEWEGDTLHFTRSGVNGKIAVTDKDVHVRAELGFLMGAMKPMIESEIERVLDENFA